MGGAPHPLPAGPRGRLPSAAGRRAALDAGSAPWALYPRALDSLLASAPAPLSTPPVRRVCPVLGVGSQAGRADPPASPRLPQECG